LTLCQIATKVGRILKHLQNITCELEILLSRGHKQDHVIRIEGDTVRDRPIAEGLQQCPVIDAAEHSAQNLYDKKKDQG
jgi:hypothetical protein